ncbi:hypothetical protein C4577_01510 [Candidatus Parcubacteria bacterium]|nr:MAG: hypothetical protein C4577_01510 [Candidatus Parcubacteria bacterium]
MRLAKVTKGKFGNNHDLTSPYPLLKGEGKGVIVELLNGFKFCYTFKVRARRRFSLFLFFSFLSFIFLGGLIIFTDPSKNLQISNYFISPIIFFFLIIFIIFFSLFSFLFLNKRRGLAAGLFLVLLLIMRFFGFREIFQVVILFLIVVLFDFFFLVKKS